MIGKKGVWNHLIEIILIIVVAFILIGGAQQLVGILKKGSDFETCRLSILAQAQTKLGGSSFVPLKCERRKVEIFKDKVEINGRKESKYEFEELDENVVNKVVAEELRLCWYMAGEGKVNVFEQDISSGGENVCLICSEINFDKNVDRSRQFTGLLDYLKGNKIPDKDIQYFDYLINSQRNLYLLWGRIPWTQYNPWWYGTTDNVDYTSFDQTQRYVVYFLAWKPDWLNEKLRTYTSAYYIGLGKPEKITKDCRRLVN